MSGPPIEPDRPTMTTENNAHRTAPIDGAGVVPDFGTALACVVVYGTAADALGCVAGGAAPTLGTLLVPPPLLPTLPPLVLPLVLALGVPVVAVGLGVGLAAARIFATAASAWACRSSGNGRYPWGSCPGATPGVCPALTAKSMRLA